MKRVLVLVEGQTEEAFFNGLLQGYLAERAVGASCTMVCTAQAEGRRAFRGGHGGRWDLIEQDIRLLLRSKPDAVTTMLDLYGLPDDLPGRPAALPSLAAEKLKTLEDVMARAIRAPDRFIPGIVAHEFEALLFAGPEHLAAITLADKHRRARVTEELQRIVDAAGSPEEIDDGPDTAPSKRIRQLIPEYEKPRHGPAIAERIGIERIRARCPLFSAWLARLEAIGKEG